MSATAFDAIDRNHDGVITREEFAAVGNFIQQPPVTATLPTATLAPTVTYAAAPTMTYTAAAPVTYVTSPGVQYTTAPAMEPAQPVTYAAPAAEPMVQGAVTYAAPPEQPGTVTYVTAEQPAYTIAPPVYVASTGAPGVSYQAAPQVTYQAAAPVTYQTAPLTYEAAPQVTYVQAESAPPATYAAPAAPKMETHWYTAPPVYVQGGASITEPALAGGQQLVYLQEPAPGQQVVYLQQPAQEPAGQQVYYVQQPAQEPAGQPVYYLQQPAQPAVTYAAPPAAAAPTTQYVQYVDETGQPIQYLEAPQATQVVYADPGLVPQYAQAPQLLTAPSMLAPSMPMPYAQSMVAMPPAAAIEPASNNIAPETAPATLGTAPADTKPASSKLGKAGKASTKKGEKSKVTKKKKGACC
jgi:hypothetical protein